MAFRRTEGQASNPMDDRPKPITPVEEHYEGVNFPYRGTEQHGVSVPDNTRYPDTHLFHMEEEKPDIPEDALPEPDPILVKVVQDHARELKKWRVVRIPVGQNAIQVVGKNLNRRNLRIRNLDDTNPIYIGPDSNVTSYTGYKIPAGTEPQPYITTEEIWATTGDETVVEIAVLFEYAVEL